jgi:hypothetical protein
MTSNQQQKNDNVSEYITAKTVKKGIYETVERIIESWRLYVIIHSQMQIFHSSKPFLWPISKMAVIH